MKGFDTVQIKIKDGLYINLYYRNHFFSTSYVLPERIRSGEENPYFNEHLQKLRKAYGDNYVEVNKILKRKKAYYDSLIVEAEGKGLDPITYIKLHFKKKNQETEKELLSYSTLLVDQFQKWYERKRHKSTSKKRSSVTEVPQAVLANLRHYESDLKIKFTLSSINMDWIEEFSKWCVTAKTRTNQVYRKNDDSTYTTTKTVQLSNSTLKRHLIEIRAFLKHASELDENLEFPLIEIKNYYSKLPTRHKKKVEKESWSYDYLTRAEWDVVKKYKVPEVRRKEWHNIFDMFLFSCNTGLRYVDLKQLTALDIQNDKIKLHAQKTITKVARGAVTVELNDQAKKILEKHRLPYTPEDEPIFGHILPINQQANITLRKVLSEIEILHEKKLILNFHLFKEEKAYKRKCDVLSWHSSRRTFVNLLVRNNASIQQIQSMTGWIDINSIISYMAQIEDDDEGGLGIVNSF